MQFNSKSIFVLLFILAQLSVRSFAHTENIAGDNYQETFSIVENKGQWDRDVYYAIPLPHNSALYVTQQGLVYDLRKPMPVMESQNEHGSGRDYTPSVRGKMQSLKGYCFRMSLAGSSGFNTILPSEEMVTKYHYYLGASSKDWYTNVKSYKALLIKDVYEGIDFKLYIQNGKIKYDFIIGAGKDYRVIRLKYDSVGIQIEEQGNLLIKNSVSDLTELAPVVYQVSKDGDTIMVPSAYHALSPNSVGYQLTGNYDSSLPLVIDPQLVFSTFSGARDHPEWATLAYASGFSQKGEFYTMATAPLADYEYRHVFGQYSIDYLLDTAVAYGAVGINKYSADGTQLVHSIVLKCSIVTPSFLNVDLKNNLYVGLVVNSDTELPSLPNMYISPTAGGETDIYLCKISEDGDSLLGAAIIGGSGFEGNTPRPFFEIEFVQLEMKLLKNGNVAFVSNTNSADYLTTADALHPKYLGGDFDGIFTVLDEDLQNIIYSTYIGGAENDYCLDVIETDQEELVIGGSTYSSNLKMSGSEVYQKTKKALGDGFIMKFNQYYEYQNSTYMGGDGEEFVIKLAALKDGTLHALVNFPTYQQQSADAFNWLPGYNIFKMDRDLKKIERAVSVGAFTPSAFITDICGNTYLSGFDLDGPTTPDALQKGFGLWLGVYSEDFTTLRYGTTYGKNGHYHNGVVRFDPLGIMYQVACSADPNYPVTPNAIFPKKLKGGVEPMAFKIDLGISFVKADIYLKDADRIGCTTPFTVKFNNNTVSRFPASYYWDFGDGRGTSRLKEPEYTFKHSGKYSVVLTASSSGSCNEVDRDTIEILVYDTIQLKVPDVYLCNNPDSVQLNALPSFPLFERMKIQWEPAAGVLAGQGTLTPIVSPAIAQSYKIDITMPLHCAFHISEQMNIIDAKIGVEIDTNYTCFNEDVGSISVQKAKADSFNYFYLWTNIYGDTLGTGDHIEGLSKGRYYLYVNNGHCDSLFPLEISRFDEGVSFDNPQDYWCVTDHIALNNSSNEYYTSFKWFMEDILMDSSKSFDQVVNSLGGHIFRLTGAGEKCKDTSEHQLYIDPVSLIRFTTSKEEICEGEAITFHPSPQSDSSVLQLRWSLGETQFLTESLQGIRHAFDQAGTIPITLTTWFRACPSSSYNKTIQVHRLPKVDLGEDSGLCLNGHAIELRNLIVEENRASQSYSWSNGTVSENILVTHPGHYSLTVKEAPLGCSTTESIEVRKDCYLDIPNAFSPNGDGYNDYFFPRSLLSQKLIRFTMKIFNRWGQLIFETSNIDGRGWDGEWNGKAQVQGVYVYMIEAEMENQAKENFQGNVTLIR